MECFHKSFRFRCLTWFCIRLRKANSNDTKATLRHFSHLGNNNDTTEAATGVVQ